jgi:hypothetical protein
MLVSNGFGEENEGRLPVEDDNVQAVMIWNEAR